MLVHSELLVLLTCARLNSLLLFSYPTYHAMHGSNMTGTVVDTVPQGAWAIQPIVCLLNSLSQCCSGCV